MRNDVVGECKDKILNRLELVKSASGEKGTKMFPFHIKMYHDQSADTLSAGFVSASRFFILRSIGINEL